MSRKCKRCRKVTLKEHKAHSPGRPRDYCAKCGRERLKAWKKKYQRKYRAAQKSKLRSKRAKRAVSRSRKVVRPQSNRTAKAA
jgi:hypothetical protein